MIDSEVGGDPRRLAIRTILVLGAVALLTGCGGECPNSKSAAGVAELLPNQPVLAEVNGAPVYSGQLEEIREAERLRLGAEGRSAVEIGLEDERIRIEGLRLAINAELCYQAARAAGLEVDSAEVDRRIEGIRSQHVSEEEFEEYLSEAGLDLERLRRRAERKILIKTYVRSITDRLEFDEAEAERIYEEQKERFRESEQVRAAQIIVRVLPGAPAAERSAAREKIDEAWSRLQAGEPFEEVAREYSESPFAPRGGDLGFIPRGRALPEFDAVVFDAPVGSTTPVFETPHGFNIVKVIDRREGGVKDFDEVKGALLMLLAREQNDGRLRAHIGELRAAATIRVLDPQLAEAGID